MRIVSSSDSDEDVSLCQIVWLSDRDCFLPPSNKRNDGRKTLMSLMRPCLQSLARAT